MEVILLDEAWPLVVLKLKGEAKTEEDIHSVIKTWTHIYMESMSKNEKHRLIFDVRESKMVNVELIRIFSSFLERVKKLTENWMERTAILVSDDKIRLLIGLVFTVYKPIRPFKVFMEDSKAIEWALGTTPGEDPNGLKSKVIVQDSKIEL